MKKNGFTLAEVLITLAIIGVVATLTLPALMTNTAEQQARTALKKGINTLTEAATMNATLKGFDYGSVIASDQSEDAMSLWAILSTQLSVDWKQTDDGKKGYGYGVISGNTYNTSNYTIFLRDGASISFPTDLTMSSSGAATIESDRLPHGLPVMYDINGNKGPNLLSNCSGTVASTKVSDPETGSNNASICDTKTNRVIKDRFGLRLRNNVVVPNGAATKYVLSD